MKLLHANDRPGQHAPSWYRDSCQSATRASLERELDCDVAIVGAGFTGLAAARELAEAGYRTVVLEAHRVGWGASGRNGGQLGSGFNLDQKSLEQLVGRQAAHALWQISEDAKRYLQDLISEQAMDVEWRPGIVYARHRKRHLAAARDHCHWLEREYGYRQMEYLEPAALRDHVQSENYHGAVLDHGAAHLHPLKLATGLAAAAERAGATIHETSEVLRIATARPGGSHRLITATGSVRCSKVIIAANGYLDELVPALKRCAMPINNFIIVTGKLGERARQLLPHDNAVADSRFVVNYFRRVDDDRLLFGGGENYTYRFPRSIRRNVRSAMLRVFPQLHDAPVEHAWGGTLAITRNRLPYLLQPAPDVYAAGGYSGHGLALAPMYGRAIAEHIRGEPDRLQQLAAIPLTGFPGSDASRAMLLALAMTGYSWLDRF